MATDISIMISAKDNFSEAIKKMKETQTAFRKDLGQLDKELTALNKNKITLKTDLTKAKRELNEASKAFAETGDEAARLRMEAAQADYDNIRQNLDLVGKAAKQTTRDMENLTGVVSKTETRMGVSEGGTLAMLAKAGAFAMVGNAAMGLGGTLIGSAYGSQTGDAVSSILGGAVSGAALGSVVPGVGTAVGAALGALTGAIQSYTKIFESEDEAFKSVVQDQYETLMQ
ncbi:MAG TPA: phage tail protein, partial [Clostridia bacterium]|nr:phage tail protein [Clostridia bacterium]